jgi:tRNA acetyltransferase TAN1
VQYFIGDIIGDENLRVYLTHVSGLITCKTSLDPFEVIEKLREIADENPYQFRFAIKFTPLLVCVSSDIDSIVKAVEALLPMIGEDDSFRVTVRRRHTDLQNKDVVNAAASVVSRKVDLDNPDKIILIEIVGELTGISVITSEDAILSIMTMRDDMY